MKRRTVIYGTSQNITFGWEKKKKKSLAINLTEHWLISFKHFTFFIYRLQVKLTVSPLPALNSDDQLLCTFGDTTHPAQLNEGVIICGPPKVIPPTPEGQGKEILLPAIYNKRKERKPLFPVWCFYMNCMHIFFFFQSFASDSLLLIFIQSNINLKKKKKVLLKLFLQCCFHKLYQSPVFVSG